MSTNVSTTQELSENIIAQLETTLGQTIPFLPKSFLRVLSKTMAAVYILLYKYIGFGTLQGFVRTASAEPTTVNGKVFTPLYEWGELVGVGLPAPATRAELTINITVEVQSGTLPTGSQLIYPDTGVTYITLGAVLLDAPVVNTTIRAVADQSDGRGAGAIGNLEVGQIVSFANPLANVARNTTVTAQVVTGSDGEAIEVYRQRVLNRFRQRPQGGALTDYKLWGEEPAGIVTVYPYRSNCPGQVDVYVEATPESSGDPDGFPTNAQLQEVLDSINFNEAGLASRRPVGALVNTFSISRTSFDVTVTGLVVDDAATVQAQIIAAVTDYFLEREPFLVGLSVPPRIDRITVTSIGGLVDSIVSASNGIFSSVILLQAATSINTYTLGVGEESKVGTILFI